MVGEKLEGKNATLSTGTEFMSLLEIEDKKRLLNKKILFLPHASINEVKKVVGKTQQSIYSIKTADKAEK